MFNPMQSPNVGPGGKDFGNRNELDLEIEKDTKELAKKHYEKGVVKELRFKYAEAEKEYRKAVSIYPKDVYVQSLENMERKK